MDKYDEFSAALDSACERLKEIPKKGQVRIVSHLDADGISACAILAKTLNILNRSYSITILPQLNEKVIKELSSENHSLYFFTDFGSSQLPAIAENFIGKNVFILDHHEISEVEKLPESITHVNPHIHEIDGSKEISGAGVVYLFCKRLAKELKLAHIAVIGAIGDVQDSKEGFMKLNSEIVEDAVKDKTVSVSRGIRFFGRQTRPLHKLLEYSTDPYIPGVSGSESSAIQFLHQIGINPKIGGDWKKIVHLSDDELKKLIAGIVMRRINEEDPEDILGNVYTLINEEKESPTRDAKEFSTLLNACGRMNKASLGIGACLGDKRLKQKALRQLAEYKRTIIDAIKWFNSAKNTESIISESGFTIINAGESVSPTIIGTLASIISKSGEIEKNTYIMSMARADDGTTKVSLRISGIRQEEGVDLHAVVEEITRQVGGESGGHTYAAGAIISTENELKFIDSAKNVLSKHAIVERVEETVSKK